MMKKYIAITTCLLLPYCADSTAKGRTVTTVSDTAVTVRLQNPELELPEVPASLRKPADRANYIINHFWDAMDFRDTLRSHDIAFMEQSFSNFISVFPHAESTARATAVATLMQMAEADSTAYNILAGIAEKYLYDLQSPFASEEFYIPFLEQLINSPIAGRHHNKARLRYRLDALNKNRPGMTAADFQYTITDGSFTTLHATPVASRLLLMFYDPTCEHCQEVMDELQDSPTLSSAVASGKIKVLAVYSGDDLELWRRTASALPAAWTAGYENGMMQETGLYILRTMPTLYLLDANKEVILKDTSLEQLSEMFDK